ncbi:MAG: hypothetical protein U5O39_05170 [Gammaproteobacteria bacterium]|nr:hypothetical protein [Gammaproteobacteria bacterium]
MAAVPFVIVLLIPVGIAAVYFAKDGEPENVIAPVELEQYVRLVCPDAEPLTQQVKACPEPVQGGE